MGNIFRAAETQNDSATDTQNDSATDTPNNSTANTLNDSTLDSLYDYKVIKPFLPSLSHLSLVSVAIPLMDKFDKETLEQAYNDIKEDIQHLCQRCCRKIPEEKYEGAKTHLMMIPVSLRKTVMYAVESMHYQIFDWHAEHSGPRKKYGDVKFYWRCDGSIDRTKTAQQLIRNENISIRSRFELACIYCLEETVRDLWTEMEASGQTGDFNGGDNSMVGFGVRWLRGGSRAPWIQALHQLNPRLIRTSLISYSSILPLMQPGERQEFLFHCLRRSTTEDFRLCLHTLTKEEEEQLLLRDAEKFLFVHLSWPLQSMFLETAEKLLQYLDGGYYKKLVDSMLDQEFIFKYFDYHQLFESFWEMSPEHLKNIAKESELLAAAFEEHFEEKKKRKILADELNLKSKEIKEGMNISSLA